MTPLRSRSHTRLITDDDELLGREVLVVEVKATHAMLDLAHVLGGRRLHARHAPSIPPLKPGSLPR